MLPRQSQWLQSLTQSSSPRGLSTDTVRSWNHWTYAAHVHQSLAKSVSESVVFQVLATDLQNPADLVEEDVLTQAADAATAGDPRAGALTEDADVDSAAGDLGQGVEDAQDLAPTEEDVALDLDPREDAPDLQVDAQGEGQDHREEAELDLVEETAEQGPDLAEDQTQEAELSRGELL